MKKINFSGVFDFYVSSVDSDSFVLEELVGKYILFIDGEQAVLPVRLFFNKNYDLKILDLKNGKKNIGLSRNLSKNDLLVVSDKKTYSETTFIDDNYTFSFDNNFICTTAFKDTPLFYKFYVDEVIAEDFNFFDEFDVVVENFYISNNFVYFNPQQNKNYFYNNNGIKKPIFYSKASDNKIFSESIINNEFVFKNVEYISFFQLFSLNSFSEILVSVYDEADKVTEFKVNSTSSIDFYRRENLIPVFGKVSKIKLSSKIINNTDLAKEKFVFYFSKEETHSFFESSSKTKFKKKSINDVIFLAKEFLNYGYEFYSSKNLIDLDIQKKYKFENDSFIEQEDGNISFDSNNFAQFLIAPFFNFEESNIFTKTPVLSVPSSVDYEYYSFNFKPIFVDLVVKDEL